MKYTEDVLIRAAAESFSIAGVLRKLGVSPSSGGMNAHIKSRMKKFGISLAHFTGQGHQKGKPARTKLNWKDVLVLNRKDRKEDSGKLRRAMLESGMEYKCEACGILPFWNDRPLTLEADHKNGNNLDNRKENLRFLCPNCHSQTSNFRSKNAKWDKSPNDGMADESDLKSDAAYAA